MKIKTLILTLVLFCASTCIDVQSQSLFDKSTITFHSSLGRNYIINNEVGNPGMTWTLGALFNLANVVTLGSNYAVGSSSGVEADGSYRNSFRIYDVDIGYVKTFKNAKNSILNKSSLSILGGVALFHTNINSWSVKKGLAIYDMSFFSYKLGGGYSYRLNELLTAKANVSYYLTLTNLLDGLNTGSKDDLLVFSLGLGYNINVFDARKERLLLYNAIQENIAINNKLLMEIAKIDVKSKQGIKNIETQNDLVNIKSDSIAKDKAVNNSDTLTIPLSYILENAPEKNNDSVKYTIKYPRDKYNVVFGGFFSIKNALSEVAKMKKSGFNAEPYWKGEKSKLVFLVVFSSNDYQEAQEKVRYFRKKGYTDVWLYTSNSTKK